MNDLSCSLRLCALSLCVFGCLSGSDSWICRRGGTGGETGKSDHCW